MIEQRILAATRLPTNFAPLGLAYADGVFETIRRVNGQLPLWRWHRQRLSDSLRRLGLDQPDWPVLQRELAEIAAEQSDVVLKIICFSATAGRGYERGGSTSACLLQCHALPSTPEHLHAVTSPLRLGAGSSLTGIKSLARTEQRVAATLARQAGYDAALLLSRDGNVVSFSHGNVLLRRQGVLYTPPIQAGALAGVVRSLILAAQPCRVRVAAIPLAWLDEAEELMLCNAVRGVQSVIALDDRNYRAGPSAKLCQDWLAQQGLPALDGSSRSV